MKSFNEVLEDIKSSLPQNKIIATLKYNRPNKIIKIDEYGYWVATQNGIPHLISLDMIKTVWETLVEKGTIISEDIPGKAKKRSSFIMALLSLLEYVEYQIDPVKLTLKNKKSKFSINKLPKRSLNLFTEGGKKLVTHYIIERNPDLKKEAIKDFMKKNGSLFCEVCGFNFQSVYGEIGTGFIEVHHKVPLSRLTRKVKNSIGDIALLCSNCHSMIHKNENPLTIDQLKKIINKQFKINSRCKSK